MRLAQLPTVATLATRLREIDKAFAYCQDREAHAGLISLTIARTGTNFDFPVEPLIEHLQKQRTEIVFDLASYGVSVS